MIMLKTTIPYESVVRYADCRVYASFQDSTVRKKVAEMQNTDNKKDCCNGCFKGLFNMMAASLVYDRATDP